MKQLRSKFRKILCYIMMVTTIGISTSCDVKDETGAEMNSSDSNITETGDAEKAALSDNDEGIKVNTDTLTVLLTSDTSSLLITHAVKQISIRPVDQEVKEISLTIQNKNLYQGEFDNGYLVFGKQKLRSAQSEDYRTTKWFPVLAGQGKSLILSGTAHNRSTWQFKTAEGKLLTEAGVAQNYKEAEDVLQDKTFSKVDIPENAVSARVYYACYKDGEGDSLDDRLQIEYGKIPTDYRSADQKTITLPSVMAGDILCLEEGHWFLKKNSGNEELALEAPKLQVGDMISLTVDSTCEVQITWEKNAKLSADFSYGVRWNINDSNPVCERVGDAVGLHFNAVVGDSQLTPYDNDFDHIYPWSAMKLCAVKVKPDGSREITYSGAEGFALDGSAGNIMVEIPKFYCKREVIGDYEYWWISATKQEGFTVDPSFVTSEGEVDAIYIGTYLSSIANNKLVSVSGSFPLIKRSFANLGKLIKNSEGFAECDLLAILTVARLYLVETAVLDSQSVFAGNVNLPYLLKDKSTSYYAVRSEEAANRIYVSSTKMTQKFRVGDAVSILGSWKEFDNTEDYQRVITDIHEVWPDMLEIKFTGRPLDIIERVTGITCIPAVNGETDLIPGLTGEVTYDSGLSSFKYRGIENLWGNVSILLDNAYVKNSKLYIKYPDNKTVKIGYTLPVQNVQLSAKQFGSPTNMIVKRMGYDTLHPLIMFPSEIGNGALTSSYFCDSWYNLAEEDVTYLLTYGGAWDNKGYAGVFNFRATFTKKDAIPFNGSRIMLR